MKDFCVSVLDRGFIMIGHLVIDGDWATIKMHAD